ncbi:hypothetical protein P7C71_g4088, partial [Lecanoromycetidae sp. Uapishka_2]
MSPSQAPFTKQHELDDSLSQDPTVLPSQPGVILKNVPLLRTFLRINVTTPILNSLAPRLWLISTPSSANISSLHHQLVRNRRIVLTEDPGLHLLWIYDRIYIKPLPAYLLSYDFWCRYLLEPDTKLDETRDEICKAAAGLLRTYSYLILYQSDFRIAQREDLQLIPRDVTWENWCRFSADCALIKENAVAPRYHYGELRLTRLNSLTTIFLRKMHYHQTDNQYREYFGRFCGPLLFLFASLSVLLNTLQVGLAVQQVHGERWLAINTLSASVTMIALSLLCSIMGLSLLLFLIKVLDEVVYALKAQVSRTLDRQKGHAAKDKYAV